MPQANSSYSLGRRNSSKTAEEIISNVSLLLHQSVQNILNVVRSTVDECIQRYMVVWHKDLELVRVVTSFVLGDSFQQRSKTYSVREGLVQEVTFLICNAIFPALSDAQPHNKSLQCLVPACPESCRLLRSILSKLSSAAQSLINPVVHRSAQALLKTCLPSQDCLTMNNKSRELAHQRLWWNESLASNKDPVPVRESFCVGPLRPTEVAEHALDLKTYLPRMKKWVHDNLGLPQDILSDDFIKDRLQCGLSCNASLSGFSESDQTWITAFVGLFGWVATLCSLFACLTFAINHRSLQDLPKRLIFSVNCGCLLWGVSFVPTSFKAGVHLACHGDGTIRIRELGSSGACTTVGVLFFVGFSHLFVMTACFGHALWDVIRHLEDYKSKAAAEIQARKDRRRFWVYLSLSVIVTIPSLAVTLKKRGLAGVALLRTCLVEENSMFYHLTIPAIISVAVAVLFLVLGLGKLFLLKRTSLKTAAILYREKHTALRTCKNSADSKSVRGLNRLIKQMTVQLLGVIFAIIALISWTIVLRTFHRTFEKSIATYVLCALRNEENTKSCPAFRFPIPLSAFIVLSFFPSTFVLVLSSWALRVRYWPCLKKLRPFWRQFVCLLKYARTSRRSPTVNRESEVTLVEEEYGHEKEEQGPLMTLSHSSFTTLQCERSSPEVTGELITEYRLACDSDSPLQEHAAGKNLMMQSHS